MPGIALLGTQWGDEGKGKVTHLMADAMDMVVRYQGGNNAGHTVIVGTETFKLNLLLTKIYGRLPMNADAILEEYLGYAGRLESHITDTIAEVHAALDAGRNVLFEGAQGTLLDLDYGTYPFVTSSNPVAGGVCTGAGVGPRAIDRIIGVTKAYTTRVGEGPFPTEDLGPDGELMVERAAEYGATTGRKRRCGWFDAVVVRYAARLNSLTEIFLTTPDVLRAFEAVRVCVGYEH